MDDINSIIYAIHPSDTLDELKENQNNNYWCYKILSAFTKVAIKY